MQDNRYLITLLKCEYLEKSAISFKTKETEVCNYEGQFSNMGQ